MNYWMKSIKNYTGQQSNADLFTDHVLPHQIPTSHKAKHYRESCLSSVHGIHTFKKLTHSLPPTCVVNGYMPLTESKSDSGIQAFVDHEGKLLLLRSSISPRMTQKIDRLEKKKRQALQNHKPLNIINTIKADRHTAILAGKNDAVIQVAQLFAQNPDLNLEAFLYPIHVTDRMTAASIADIVRRTRQYYMDTHLIPVVTSSNMKTQAALDFYLALQLNKDERSALREFRQLTHTRLKQVSSIQEAKNMKVLRDNIAIAYLQDNHTDRQIISRLENTHSRHTTKFDRQIAQLAAEERQIKKSANVIRMTYTNDIHSLTASLSQVQRKLQNLKHKRRQQLSNTKQDSPKQTRIVNKQSLHA